MIKKTKLGLMVGALFCSSLTYAQAEHGVPTLSDVLESGVDVSTLQNTIWYENRHDLLIKIGTQNGPDDDIPIEKIQKIGKYCVPSKNLSITDLTEDLKDYKTGMRPLTFQKLSTSPCQALPKDYSQPKTVQDYQFLLDLYKKDMKTHYAFTPGEMDWDAYKIQDNSISFEEDFIAQIKAILEELQDCHNLFFDPKNEQLIHVGCTLDVCQTENSESGFLASLISIINSFDASILNSNALNLLDAQRKEPYELTDFQQDFVNSKLGDTLTGKKIGYLRVYGFPEYDQDYLRGLEHVMEGLTDKDALIIDVRINMGGSDRGAIALAERFMNWDSIEHSRANEIDYVTVKTFKDGTLDEGKPYVVHKTESTHFHKPVIVLTSPSTISAGDQFVVAVKRLVPDAIRVGRKTPSFYSNLFWRNLSNGMSYGMTNENFYLNGASLEKDEHNKPKGIEPDYRIEGQTFENYYSQDNPSFNKALELIKEKLSAK
jgi:hypothetical protein